MVFFKSFKANTLTILERENDDMETGTTLNVGTPLVGRFAPRASPPNDSYHLSQWSEEFSCMLMNLGYNQNKVRASISEALVLKSALHEVEEEEELESFSLMGHKVRAKEIEWGVSFKASIDLSYTPGYWEWSEDVLGRHGKFLKDNKLYGAIFASLFSYDRHVNVIKAFLESWCSSTNTLHCSIGELSISLRDLYVIGGLPFCGRFYEEVVPCAKELSVTDKDGNSLLPSSCRYLFLAFHRLCKQYKRDRTVKISEWTKLWFRGATKHSKPPPRRGSRNKTQRPKETYNPSGMIAPVKNCSPQEDEMFTGLGIKPEMRNKTYLAAFIACWLCKFVLPTSPGNIIRPEVFKIASMMADGNQFCLSVPVLASIYRGLNDIVSSSDPGNSNVSFPIHYVYGWLAEYFKTNFFIPECNYLPRMTRYAGEGSAKHFDETEAQELFRLCKGVELSYLSRTSPTKRLLTDDEKLHLYDFEYLASLRSSYLTLRQGDRRIIEPYSPHRFGRQFCYHQDIPGKLKKDIRTGTLEEMLPLWKSTTRYHTGCEVQLPSNSNFQKFSVTKTYTEWWSKVYVDPFMVKGGTSGYTKRTISPKEKPAKVRKVTIIGLKSTPSFKPTSASKSHSDHDVEESSESQVGVTQHIPPQINIRPHTSLVIDSDEDMGADDEDRNWKHMGDKTKRISKRADFITSRGVDRYFGMASSSDEPMRVEGTGGYLEEDIILIDNPTGSGTSVCGPSAFELVPEINGLSRASPVGRETPRGSDALVEREISSQTPQAVVQEPQKVNLSSHQVVPPEVSAFDSEAIILSARRKSALALVESIKSIVINTPTHKVPFLGLKLDKLYNELSKSPGDYSGLKIRVELYMKNVARYIDAKSSYASMMTSDQQSEQLTHIDTLLLDATTLEDTDSKHVQSLQSALSDAEDKETRLLEELQQVREEAKQLRASIEESNAQLSQRKEAITKLRRERDSVEEANILAAHDLEIMRTLEELLQTEREEILTLQL